MMQNQLQSTEVQMSFVREPFPEEFKKTNPKECQVDDFWQIDRERDAVFYCWQSNWRGLEKVFKLIWQGKTIEVGAVGLTDRWDDISFFYPQTDKYAPLETRMVKENKREVVKLIIDALTAFSQRGNSSIVPIFTFDPRMNVIEGI